MAADKRREWAGARSSKPEDFVRLEILTALEQRLRVIPVLVGNAGMPKAHELPKDLQEFADCHAFELEAISVGRSILQGGELSPFAPIA